MVLCAYAIKERECKLEVISHSYFVSMITFGQFG